MDSQSNSSSHENKRNIEKQQQQQQQQHHQSLQLQLQQQQAQDRMVAQTMAYQRANLFFPQATSASTNNNSIQGLLNRQVVQQDLPDIMNQQQLLSGSTNRLSTDRFMGGGTTTGGINPSSGMLLGNQHHGIGNVAVANEIARLQAAAIRLREQHQSPQMGPNDNPSFGPRSSIIGNIGNFGLSSPNHQIQQEHSTLLRATSLPAGNQSNTVDPTTAMFVRGLSGGGSALGTGGNVNPLNRQQNLPNNASLWQQLEHQNHLHNRVSSGSMMGVPGGTMNNWSKDLSFYPKNIEITGRTCDFPLPPLSTSSSSSSLQKSCNGKKSKRLHLDKKKQAQKAKKFIPKLTSYKALWTQTASKSSSIQRHIFITRLSQGRVDIIGKSRKSLGIAQKQSLLPPKR